eukprot:1157982-Pelagomonas_calceolata.AAC.8
MTQDSSCNVCCTTEICGVCVRVVCVCARGTGWWAKGTETAAAALAAGQRPIQCVCGGALSAGMRRLHVIQDSSCSACCTAETCSAWREVTQWASGTWQGIKAVATKTAAQHGPLSPACVWACQKFGWYATSLQDKRTAATQQAANVPMHGKARAGGTVVRVQQEQLFWASLARDSSDPGVGLKPSSESC